MQISKALQAWSKAIQMALKHYNRAAEVLDPARPQLHWQEVVEYSSLAEFDLLRTMARDDIRNHAWADTINRQITIHKLQMERAHEEIARVNVEVARLTTWMHDEEAEYKRCIAVLQETQPLLCGELQERLNYRVRQNDIHRHKFAKLFPLPGYTGSTEVGHRLGSSGFTIRIPVHVLDCDDDGTSHEDRQQDRNGGDTDDEDNEEMTRLEDFITNIPE